LADGLAAIPHDPLPKTKYDMKLQAAGGGALFIGPHLLLPTDKVRHVGEAVAMVVAETMPQALDAAEAVAVDYDVLPGVYHSEDAMRRGASVVWNEVPGNVAGGPWVRGSEAAGQGVPPARPRRGHGLPHRSRDRRTA